jgi:multimeric flavodoxin WrbA
MGILIVTGSHRPRQISYRLATQFRRAFQRRAERFPVEICELADKNIQGCCASARCSLSESKRCLNDEDDFNAVYDRICHSDAVLFLLPKYAPYPSRFLALVERLVAIAYWGFIEPGLLEQFALAGKPAAVLAFCNSPDVQRERFTSLFESIRGIGFDVAEFDGVPGYFLSRSREADGVAVSVVARALVKKLRNKGTHL